MRGNDNVVLRDAGDALGIVAHVLPSTLRWSSYEATPEPLSLAAFQATRTGIVDVMAQSIGRVTRGGCAIGAESSTRTVMLAVPVTPFAVATTWPVPAVVATK